MKCNSCGSEWNAGSSVSGAIQKCPFCGRILGMSEIIPPDEYRMLDQLCRKNDDAGVFRIYERYANMGHVWAQSQLAALYSIGKGVACDHQKSVFWCRKAADNGDTEAMHTLALSYRHGMGVPADLKMAFEYDERAAKLGNTAAMSGLIHCYLFGKGVEKNEEMVVHWASVGARLGDCSCTSWLAHCYHHGTGVRKDLEQAIILYEKVAARDWGGAYVLFQLGELYESTGRTWKAKENYLKSAQGGYHDAMYRMAVAYENGELGLSRNQEQAIDWYLKVADQKSGLHARDAVRALLRMI